jgi:serine/threonine protein kinase
LEVEIQMFITSSIDKMYSFNLKSGKNNKKVLDMSLSSVSKFEHQNQIQEKMVSDLQKAILENNHRHIDQTIDVLLSSDCDITTIWQQVISHFEGKSDEQTEAKTYYKITVVQKELQNQEIKLIIIDSLYKICSLAEDLLTGGANNKTTCLMKKEQYGIDHSLLIDFQKGTFTICGVGPIKKEGGCGKIRSAIEVALKQGASNPLEQVATKFVVRKTNLPRRKITEKELRDEQLFGTLRTFCTYKGAKGAQKTTFTMDAYQTDLLEQLQDIQESKQPPLTFSEQLQILYCIAKELECMHEKHSTIHYDVKPENVLFRRNKDGTIEVKLSDFGLSYRPLKGEAPRRLNSYGTKYFTSPEVLENPQAKYTLSERKAQDIYALGCVAYEVHYQQEPDWYEDVEQALKNKDSSARAKALTKQKEIARACDFDPRSPKDAYKLLVHRLLHPNKEERPTIQEACLEISEIIAQYVLTQALIKNKKFN